MKIKLYLLVLFIIFIVFNIEYIIGIFMNHKISNAEKKDNVEVTIINNIVKLNPDIVPVCACESLGDPKQEPKQFDKQGNVIQGPGNNWGICQINKTVHGERAISLGIDIMTEEGNITYANMLYEESGYQPWFNWSGHCWKDDPRINQKKLLPLLN